MVLVEFIQDCLERLNLNVEGDWNDADYVNRKVRIDKDVLENDDYLLYFISYIST